MRYWIDVESTGLDPDRGLLLEVGLVIADPFTLDEVSRHSWIIRPVGPLPPMDLVVIEMHTKTGLFAELRNGVLLEQAEVELSQVLLADMERQNKTAAKKFNWPVAGASPQFDRSWLKVHMPSVDRLFNHRVFDVSTLKEAYRKWVGDFPDVQVRDTDRGMEHRALPDILYSLEEARVFNRAFRARGMRFALKDAGDEVALDTDTSNARPSEFPAGT